MLLNWLMKNQKDGIFRDHSFDALKGAAIITVIAIHATNSGWSWYEKDNGSWNYIFSLIMSKAYAYAVPTFFFAAGYFVTKNKYLIEGAYFRFLYQRLRRLLIPYLIFSLSITFIIHHNFNIKYVILSLLLGRVQGPYYFIIILLSLTVMTPLLFWLLNKKFGLSVILIINAFSLLVTYYLIITVDGGLAWWKASLPFTNWVFFYYLGMVFYSSEKEDRVDTLVCFKSSFIAVMIVLLFSLVETFFLIEFFDNSIGFLTITPFSTIYSFTVIQFFMAIREKRQSWPKPIVYIGQRSFGIFLLHELLRSRISDFISANDFLFSIQPIFQAIVIAITLLVCIVLINSLRSFIGRDFAGQLFGF
jgi:probable poly-beta-1,6-N-acetyl-D-glucosamine export protein